MKFNNTRTLVNFSNSILKHFMVKPLLHHSLEEVDAVMKDHKKVVVLLFDGMGQNIIRKHLKENSFIRSHYLTTIDSVFPPTTAAATTAFLSAQYPIENGWLGWDMYFEEVDANVILFNNTNYNTDEKVKGDHLAFKYFGYTSIFDLIKKSNKDVDTFCIQRYPINKDGPKTLRSSLHKISSKLHSSKECFMYYYFDTPDREMHSLGIDSFWIRHKVRQIDKFVKKLVKANPDTLFFSFADHGHINVKYWDICDHEDLYSCLRRPVSLEKRNVGFYVKEEKKEKFKELFLKYYGEYFTLYSHDEILANKVYGEGQMHKNLKPFIVDYLAISNREYSLYASKEFKNPGTYKGHHAGGTDEERLIDISVFNN